VAASGKWDARPRNIYFDYDYLSVALFLFPIYPNTVDIYPSIGLISTQSIISL